MKWYKNYLGIMCFIMITITFVITIKMLSPELKEPDVIHYDDMLDVDMDCGGSYYDSIPEYSNFNDVPASVDTMIRVDGILYKTNNNKTSWVPVYPDEYVMWVGNNGDTIWE